MARPHRIRRLAIRLLLTLVVIAAIGAALVWWKFLTGAPQSLADDRARFHYGSLDSELVAGMPYPLFMILPRVFPDLVEKYATEGYGPQKAGYGGDGAVGPSWGEGQRLAIGVAVKDVGYERGTL